MMFESSPSSLPDRLQHSSSSSSQVRRWENRDRYQRHQEQFARIMSASANADSFVMASPSYKRPRVNSDFDDCDDPLSRRAIQVYNEATRFVTKPFIARLSMAAELDNHHREFQFDDDVVDEFGIQVYGSEYDRGADEAGGSLDLLHSDNSSLCCTYKCRNLVKAEFLELLEQREKQVVELETALKSLQASLAAAEAGKALAVRQNKSLELSMAAASSRESSLHSQRIHESDRADELLRTQLKRCYELQAKLQGEMEQKAEAEAAARVAEAQVKKIKDERDREQHNAAREIVQLKMELDRLRRDSNDTLSRIKAENATTIGQAYTAAEEVEVLESQLEEQQRLFAKSLEEKCELEYKLANAMSQLAERATGPAEADTIIRHLRHELSQCTADVEEARKLKQIHVNAALLKEQLMSEKARADRAEASLAEIADIQVRLKELELELQAWRDMVGQIPGVEGRDDVLRKLRELQREVMSAMAKTGEVTAQVKELQTALEKTEGERQKAVVHGVALQEETTEAMLKIKRLESKVALLTKERDCLTAILESYDEEEDVIASHQKQGNAVALLATPEKAKDVRMKELERTLAAAQQHATDLEAVITRISDVANEHRRKWYEKDTFFGLQLWKVICTYEMWKQP